MGRPAGAAAFVVCPNSKRHYDAGWAAIQGIAAYKTEMRDGYYRSAVESDRRSCDFCWPPCPTCGHRERRRACIRCGGAEDLKDRGMAPGMTYCASCRRDLAEAEAEVVRVWDEA